MGRAAEYRDTETGMHVIRMSRYVKLLGLADGMSKEETELLLNTALMHDIGKIGIPDRIL
ncbi:MAG: HD domain-containing protein [Methyloprofundus sp.]|uniref:HD domain-containing protein n=1 Tax=Methyloprofundus sp. TaxID=2020875 RepID=UPI002630986B|nr:HD domain-containing protein [Methyloprofundus sp.]